MQVECARLNTRRRNAAGVHTDRGRQNRLKCDTMIICKMHRKEKDAPSERWTEPVAPDNEGVFTGVD